MKRLIFIIPILLIHLSCTTGYRSFGEFDINLSKLFSSDSEDYLKAVNRHLYDVCKNLEKEEVMKILRTMESTGEVEIRKAEADALISLIFFNKKTSKEVSFLFDYRLNKLQSVWYSVGYWDT
jgi:hypothetical protein